MSERELQETEIERLLAMAREAPEPEPGADLYARILADAEAAQPVAAAPVPAPSPDRRMGPVARLLRGLGGWPAAGGLVTATLLGVWLGINPPLATDGALAGWLTEAGLATSGDEWGLDPVSTYAYEVAYGG